MCYNDLAGRGYTDCKEDIVAPPKMLTGGGWICGCDWHALETSYGTHTVRLNVCVLHSREMQISEEPLKILAALFTALTSYGAFLKE